MAVGVGMQRGQRQGRRSSGLLTFEEHGIWDGDGGMMLGMG